MTARAILATLLTPLLLAACGSTPESNYYMLTATYANAPGQSDISVGVGPVSVPSYLDRQAMVLNRNDNQLRISQYERWAESLDVGVARVVAVNLANLLDTQNVTTYPWTRVSAPDFGVEVGVVELTTQAGQAQLVVKWLLTDVANQAVLAEKISRYQTPAEKEDPSSIAAAYSTLLGQFSEEVAASIRASGAAS